MARRIWVVMVLGTLLGCSSEGSSVDGGVDASNGPDASSDAPTSDAKSDGALPATCAGVTCSGFGTCVMSDAGVPTCNCKNGYVAVGLTCIVDPCKSFSCTGRCQQCIVVNGAPTCGCGPGWVANTQGGCTPDPNPCEPNPCNSNQVCVTEIHCAPSGACLQGCDCSNCGNCDNISANTNCGGTDDAGLPTVACTNPCPSGEGCIPTGSSPWGMCYPGEGCFSK